MGKGCTIKKNNIMGAFGNLLQAYFGGTIHDVKTWGAKVAKNKKKLRRPRCGKYTKELTYIPYLKVWSCDNHDSSELPKT